MSVVVGGEHALALAEHLTPLNHTVPLTGVVVSYSPRTDVLHQAALTYDIAVVACFRAAT